MIHTMIHNDHDCGAGATDEDVQCSVGEGDESRGKKEQETGGKGFHADADSITSNADDIDPNADAAAVGNFKDNFEI